MEKTKTETNSLIHIGFTGHRPNKIGGYDLSTKGYSSLQLDLETYIKRNLEVFDLVVGHSGLALGGDTIWSKAILSKNILETSAAARRDTLHGATRSMVQAVRH